MMKARRFISRRFSPKNLIWILPAGALAITLGLGLSWKIWNFYQHKYSLQTAPTPQLSNPMVRQKISPQSGGEMNAEQVVVSFPAGFTQQSIVTSYRDVNGGTKLLANEQIGPMFELKARTEQGQAVTQFSKPLTVTIKLPAEALKDHQTSDIALYYFNTDAKQWDKIGGQVDKEKGVLIAETTHFTIFMVSGGDPNGGIVQPAVDSSLIVDDQDPFGFSHDGQSDDAQPEFWKPVGAGYNGDSHYTGNSINTTPHNWATWSVDSGLEGEKEIFVTIPNLRGKALTRGAKYKVTHAGGVSTVVIDQEAFRGKVASLGKFTFNGSGSVYLNDVVPEQGSNFLSHLVFDAVSFGVPFDGSMDITPPSISNVIAQPDPARPGNLRIQATVKDLESGLKTVLLYFDPDTADGVAGTTYVMKRKAGTDTYFLSVPYQKGKNFDYYIYAEDNAGNKSVWRKGRGYVSRASWPGSLGYHAGMIRGQCGNDPQQEVKNCPPGTVNNGQTAGDPVNTLNGNLIDELALLDISGRPNIDLDLTYNSQGGRASIFGENWTHSYNYHLVELQNDDVSGVYVQYPDGKAVYFSGSGPTYTAEPGYFEKLTKVGETYELIFPDLKKVIFDGEGDILRWQDHNGNGLTFSYGQKNPYTLLSQITAIKADGGREITFTYNPEGFVETITAPEGKTLIFNYSREDDLIKFTDGRNLVTRFEYEDHQMTSRLTPEGHPQFTNKYDGERRVIEQMAGEKYLHKFEYSTNQTKLTDPNGRITTYTFTTDGLLNKITDARGGVTSYEYTDQKQVKKLTDQDGKWFEYKYDSRGNQIYEKDPLGYETNRTFHNTFNKPTQEIAKRLDNITKWEYDDKGNLKKVINPAQKESIFNYDTFGQLKDRSDFNGHLTTYTYTPEGDVKTITDAESQTKAFTYDGLGRVKTYINPRQKTYTNTYDGNDNLTEVAGPLSHKLSYSYDKNNHLKTSTDANGGTTTYSYDKSENLVSVTDPMGFTRSYSYGLANEKLSETSPEGRKTTYEYDPNYNLATIFQAAGTADEAVTRYSYSLRGDKTLMIDPLGRKTTYTYDGMRRLTREVRNPGFGFGTVASETNVITQYTYNPTGGLLTVTDPQNNTTKYDLDVLDRVKAITDAENQVTKRDYDAMGNLISLTNPRNFTTTHTYDKVDRLIATTDAKGGVTKYTYDATSNLTSTTDANNITTAYSYDDLDRRTDRIQNAQTSALTDAQTNVKTEYKYDLHGNLIGLINPRSYPTAFTYDKNHRNTVITDAYDHKTELFYDKDGNLLKHQDRNLNSREYSYDYLNRLTQALNEEKHADKFEYDKVGNVTVFTNKRNSTFKNRYDTLNRLKVATNPYAHTKTYGYDRVGNILSLTDENGHTDNFTYDKVYRLKTSTDAEGNVTTHDYDPNGNIIKTTDAENNPTAYVYDELDRLTSKTNAENETEQYGYDRTTHLTRKSEADQTAHSYTYDPLYRLAQVVNNHKGRAASSNDTNVITTYRYDANGNLIAQTDPRSNTTNFTYDKLDRLATETNPLQNTWTYAYNPEGDLTSRLDAKGIETKYDYYPDHKLAQITYPEYPVKYQYNETNFPTQMIDGLGNTTWQYDLLDRMTEQVDPYSKKLGYEYDKVGNLTKLTLPDTRSIAHTYLKNDWLQRSLTSVGDSVTYTRNKVGMPVVLDRSNATKADISYDKVYRPLTIHDRETALNGHLVAKHNYEYNDVGHQTKEVVEYGWRQPALVTTTYGYDGLHRLTDSTSTDGQRTQYVYDAAGNRTTLTEHLKQGQETRQYAYNAANQLTDIEINSPMPPNRKTYAYQYDKNGNRVDKLVRDYTGLDRGVAYSYDTENRLTLAKDYQSQLNSLSTTENTTSLTSLAPTVTEPTVTEPSPTPSPSPSASPTLASSTEGTTSGEVSSSPSPSPTISPSPTPTPTLSPSPTTITEEDPDAVGNQPTQTAMQYDGNGRRLSSTYYPGVNGTPERVEYVFDHLDPVVEYNKTNGQRKNLYRNSAQELLFNQEFRSEQDPDGNRYFYHNDGEGNVIATTKHDGQSDHTYRFDEYGTILPEEGSAGWTEPHNQYTLTGKSFDAHTRLYYFGSRYYDPEVGVWLNQDTYRGELMNPESRHRYMYNNSSPINYVDLYGYVPTEKAVNSEDMEYSCKCGWIDWAHAGLGTDKDPNPARRLYPKIQAASTRTDKKPWEVWRGDYQGSDYIQIDIHGGPKVFGSWPSSQYYIVQVDRNLTSQQQKEVTLGILMQLSIDYEGVQGDWRHRLYEWKEKKPSSSFSEEDLTSNLIGFYRILEGYSKQDVRNFCEAVGKAKSLLAVKNYQAGKNHTFNPSPNQTDSVRCLAGCSGSAPTELPPQFRTINARPEGDKWRIFRKFPD